MAAELSSAQTPVMRQYGEAKRQNPEALLLFRLGDFYELFYDDAVTASRVLELTLTSRHKEQGAPVPMCGVPYHAAESYIARLIRQGYKVALCEQMEAAGGKGLVRREVTRVLTPGTAPGGESGENTYLAAVARAEGEREAAVGLALLDVSTGEFRATEFTGPEAEARLEEELERWRPRELLAAVGEGRLFRAPQAEERLRAAITRLEPWMLEPGFGQSVLESHFGVLALEGFGLAGRTWAQAAAGAVVHYVKETQRSALAHLDRLAYYERQQGLVLDAATARNLELVEALDPRAEAATLRGALDATVTPMGKRLLRQWLLRPANEAQEIASRHEAVAALAGDWRRRDELRQALARVQDLERLLARVALATAGPRDLAALARSLEPVPELKRWLVSEEGGPAALGERLADLGRALDPCTDLRLAVEAQLAEPAPASLAEGGVIRDGVDRELDELRGLRRGAQAQLAAIEERERARTGIGSLKVRFNQIFGYYLEVTKPNLGRVPADYQRKQTVANGERFTTPELKELERRALGAEAAALELEQRLFAALRATAAGAAAAIRRNAAALGELDVLANFAHLATERQYSRPEMGGEALEIVGGRHPVVERVGAEGGRFVPNDLALEPRARQVLLVTGPNMGGKSTYLRQTALIAIMAQMGSFVPAARARLPIFDRIFTRIGASDSLARGRSTFMVEMTEAAVILNQATAASLVLLDEIGRGTATYDGLALAWAMVEHLAWHNRALTLFATHYHELTELARHLEGVANVQVAVKESGPGIVFLRQVTPGAASRSYGIEVARLAGLPPEVVARAREVLRRHEAAEETTSEQLEAPAAAVAQPRLFSPLAQQVADQLQAAELDRLSPLAALNFLAALQARLRE